MRALLGGTFNPPHQGHIKAGLEAINEIGVERLAFSMALDSARRVGAARGALNDKRH